MLLVSHQQKRGWAGSESAVLFATRTTATDVSQCVWIWSFFFIILGAMFVFWLWLCLWAPSVQLGKGAGKLLFGTRVAADVGVVDNHAHDSGVVGQQYCS